MSDERAYSTTQIELMFTNCTILSFSVGNKKDSYYCPFMGYVQDSVNIPVVVTWWRQ